MIINISDELRIASDRRGWKLERKRKHKDGCKWDAFKYFTTFRQAVVEAGHCEIRLSGATTLIEAIEDVHRAATKFAALFDLAETIDRKRASHVRPIPQRNRRYATSSLTTQLAAKPKICQVAQTELSERES